MTRLAYDKCRCQGKDCERRSTCLRHAALDDMGPATPWTERFCPDTGTTAEGYIMVREEVKQ